MRKRHFEKIESVMPIYDGRWLMFKIWILINNLEILCKFVCLSLCETRTKTCTYVQASEHIGKYSAELTMHICWFAQIAFERALFYVNLQCDRVHVSLCFWPWKSFTKRAIFFIIKRLLEYRTWEIIPVRVMIGNCLRRYITSLLKRCEWDCEGKKTFWSRWLC